MPSVKTAICPAFAMMARVEDQLVHLPQFFTWTIHRLLNEAGLVMIVQMIKTTSPASGFSLTPHGAKYFPHNILCLTMKFQSEHRVLSL